MLNKTSSSRNLGLHPKSNDDVYLSELNSSSKCSENCNFHISKNFFKRNYFTSKSKMKKFQTNKTTWIRHFFRLWGFKSISTSLRLKQKSKSKFWRHVFSNSKEIYKKMSCERYNNFSIFIKNSWPHLNLYFGRV